MGSSPVRDLLGKDLAEFSVKELTEILKTIDEGADVESIGFFEDETIAEGFVDNQTNSHLLKTRKVLVLTDGKVGFIVGAEVVLLDDEEARADIKSKALAKLSPVECEVLDLEASQA